MMRTPALDAGESCRLAHFIDLIATDGSHRTAIDISLHVKNAEKLSGSRYHLTGGVQP